MQETQVYIMMALYWVMASRERVHTESAWHEAPPWPADCYVTSPTVTANTVMLARAPFFRQCFRRLGKLWTHGLLDPKPHVVRLKCWVRWCQHLPTYTSKPSYWYYELHRFTIGLPLVDFIFLIPFIIAARRVVWPFFSQFCSDLLRSSLQISNVYIDDDNDDVFYSFVTVLQFLLASLSFSVLLLTDLLLI